MSLTIPDTEKEAQIILQKIKSGELIDACCMSAIQTPMMEAWEVATELSNNDALSPNQKTELFLRLSSRT